MKETCLALVCLACVGLAPAQGDWYTQGDFRPSERMAIIVRNTLDLERFHCPVTIPRHDFPNPDIHEMWITIVDPSLSPAGPPGDELLALQGGHQLREETHGHAIFHQLDDLDRDGIWDELFFKVDLKPGEEKTLYAYFGENIRGWNPHHTHANVGSYCRHLMPFWESEHVGWKIWFANCVDVYAKREPVLVSPILYMQNRDGYGISRTDPAYGSDIQGVAGTMGGGAICLFEHPGDPAAISLPRFTPVHDEQVPRSLWNAGQISDTRYAYETVVNGPIRSIIRIKMMNWNSGQGSYELIQDYTAYAHQNYSSCRVRYTLFAPNKAGVYMGCGIRKKPGEETLYRDRGVIISMGPEGIRDPENIDDRAELEVEFVGKAMVVKDQYEPEYQFVPAHGGNHVFRINSPSGTSFEYCIFAAWSEGAVLNNPEEFIAYVLKSREEFTHPVVCSFGGLESPGRQKPR